MNVQWYIIGHFRPIYGLLYALFRAFTRFGFRATQEVACHRPIWANLVITSGVEFPFDSGNDVRRGLKRRPTKAFVMRSEVTGSSSDTPSTFAGELDMSYFHELLYDRFLHQRNDTLVVFDNIWWGSNKIVSHRFFCSWGRELIA